jgi:hypothetical protein
LHIEIADMSNPNDSFTAGQKNLGEWVDFGRVEGRYSKLTY